MLLLEGLFRSLFLDRVTGRVIGRIQVLSSFASAIVPSELATGHKTVHLLDFVVSNLVFLRGTAVRLVLWLHDHVY